MRSKNWKIIIGVKQLDIAEGVTFVSSPKCGAINTFSGTIRDTDLSGSKTDSCILEPILGIYYETYQDMAMRQILDLINSVTAEGTDLIDSNSRVFVGVRTGFVPVGEASLIICVSSTNRTFSHRATMTILEKIKSSVVIWKKIFFTNGEIEWLDAKRSEAFWLK